MTSLLGEKAVVPRVSMYIYFILGELVQNQDTKGLTKLSHRQESYPRLKDD